MPIIQRQVGASTDDVFRALSIDAFDLGDTHNIVGADSAWNKAGAGWRFTNITIPSGATITSAYVRQKCSNATSGVTVKTRISAEKADNPATFDNKVAFDARWANRTTARMNWDSIPGWTLNTFYNSPTTDGSTTFASIIQEIIDRGGWNSGQSIVIFWDDFEDRSNHVAGCYRRSYAWDGDSANCAQLVVTYEEPPPLAGGDAAQLVAAGEI